MGIKDKINFRQPKYMLPAIIYFPLLFFGYFFFRFFDTEKAEVNNKMQTTEYYNDKLPDANLKGDGIGDKYSNMVNNFGKIIIHYHTNSIDNSIFYLFKDIWYIFIITFNIYLNKRR